MNLFELIYPRFYFSKSKKIRLFEAFSGIGCQAMALKRITDNIELVGFSEIDLSAIQSYKAIHGEVPNYGDITKMQTIPECDIFTWSFPCTDLSKAGKQKGLTNTRSGLVYNVLRLLQNTEKKPKVLIMENVVDLVQFKFVDAFNEIQYTLEQMGYTNYNEILNAKDFSIPQNRERVFMVSILGDSENKNYSFDFPRARPLKLRLKDLLEKNVDEKFYLSQKLLSRLIETNGQAIQSKRVSNSVRVGGKGSLDRHQWDIVAESKEPQLEQVAQLDGFESTGRIYSDGGLCPTINTMGGGQREPKIAIGGAIRNRPAEDGNEPHLEVREDEVSNALTTFDKDNIVITKPDMKAGTIVEGETQNDEVIVYDDFNSTIRRDQTTVGTITPNFGNSAERNGTKIIENKDPYLGVAVHPFSKKLEFDGFHDKESPTLLATDYKAPKCVQYTNLRIRKLTPLECWRLMGIADEDFWKAKNSGVSNSQLYKQAGNGIVVTVFQAILEELIK